MKTNIRFAVWLITLITLGTSVACSSSGSSDPGTATAASVLSVTPNPAIVAANASIPITPAGGTPPYTFTLQSGVGGFVSPLSGTSTTFTAGSSGGLAQLTITDAANQSILLSITISGLVVTPLTTTAAPGGTVSYTVSGGSGNYTYTALGGGGLFSGNVFTVSASAVLGSTISVQITDATSSQSVTATISVSNSVVTSSSAACEGTFSNFILFSSNNSYYPGTLQIIQDTTGNIGGNLTITGFGGPAYIGGTCGAGTINFTDSYSGSIFTGTFVTNATTGKANFMGTWTWTDPSTNILYGPYNWTAQ